MASKLKESDACKSAAPKRSLKALRLSEKVNVLNLRKEKKSHAGVAEIYGKQDSFICGMAKKEKNLCWFCCHISKCKNYGHRA